MKNDLPPGYTCDPTREVGDFSLPRNRRLCSLSSWLSLKGTCETLVGSCRRGAWPSSGTALQKALSQPHWSYSTPHDGIWCVDGRGSLRTEQRSLPNSIQPKRIVPPPLVSLEQRHQRQLPASGPLVHRQRSRFGARPYMTRLLWLVVGLSRVVDSQLGGGGLGKEARPTMRGSGSPPCSRQRVQGMMVGGSVPNGGESEGSLQTRYLGYPCGRAAGSTAHQLFSDIALCSQYPDNHNPPFRKSDPHFLSLARKRSPRAPLKSSRNISSSMVVTSFKAPTMCFSFFDSCAFDSAINPSISPNTSNN